MMIAIATVTMIFTKLIGSRYFHSKFNRRSTLNRGKDHRTHKLRNIKKNVFRKNHAHEGIYHISWLKVSHPLTCGGIHPPRKTVVAIAATINMLRYSDR